MPDYPTVDDEDPWSMMQRAGNELFNNELFSDAKVTVGDKTWPVHKSILCFRSEYFRKVFTGPFSEAATNHLTIEGQDAAAVGAILHYLYTGQADFSKALTIREAVDAFVAADYFGIEHMRGEAIGYLECYLEATLEYKSGEPLLDDEVMGFFFYAARLAYTTNLEALREPIKSFMKDIDFLLIKDDRFLKELENIPKFASALMKFMTSPENKNNMLTCCRSVPKSCTECGLNKSKFAETILVHSSSLEPAAYYQLLGVCGDCFSLQQGKQKAQSA
ncbi:histone acetyltransferase MYST2 [Apiospora rasikravindrae]|uniref:Histone acetyltransferase MYST2 n=1 Tax=Apiospora rasikravindrae TaxID=990691 RepID=A0ABR1S2L3_9PEZI